MISFNLYLRSFNSEVSISLIFVLRDKFINFFLQDLFFSTINWLVVWLLRFSSHYWIIFWSFKITYIFNIFSSLQNVLFWGNMIFFLFNLSIAFLVKSHNQRSHLYYFAAVLIKKRNSRDRGIFAGRYPTLLLDLWIFREMHFESVNEKIRNCG